MPIRLNEEIDIRKLDDPESEKFRFGKTWAAVNLHYYIKRQTAAGNKKVRKFQKIHDDFMGTLKLILQAETPVLRLKIMLLSDTMIGYEKRVKDCRFDNIMEQYILSLFKARYRAAMRLVDSSLVDKTEENYKKCMAA